MNNKTAPAPRAPALASAIEPSNTSPHRADLTGRQFLHFGPGARGPLRFGFVAGALGASHWLITFVTPAFKFSNVMPDEALESFVFFGAEADRQAFLDDLAAQRLRSSPGRTVVGRGQSSEVA